VPGSSAIPSEPPFQPKGNPLNEQSTFRELILAEARKLSLKELSLRDRCRLRLALRFNPDGLAKELLEQAKAEGVVPATVTLDSVGADGMVGSPDWQAFFGSLGDFIAKVLPLILQVLPLFL
jgi:hypothetical protein